MEVEKAISKNGVAIRLTAERWLHITEEHSEMAGSFFEVLEAVQNPDAIYEGKSGELLATKAMAAEMYLVVVYKETSKEDGFVITAFFTSKIKQVQRRSKLWPL
jgi:hypothetical protein